MLLFRAFVWVRIGGEIVGSAGPIASGTSFWKTVLLAKLAFEYIQSLYSRRSL